MLRLYDSRTARVDEISPARAGVVRVACAGGLRSLLVGDLVRRVTAHHRLRAIGIWEDVPGASDLNVRPAELASGEADVHIGETVGRCSMASSDGLDPLAVRLALLSRHYRSDVTLTRGDLAEAESSLTSWRRRVAGWAESPGKSLSSEYVGEAVAALDSDLDTPSVFPVLSRLAEDASVPPGTKFETAIKVDMILGLDLVGLVGRL
ncbi:MAG: Cysteinyl-tRNA synthetase-like protein [Actinoallomurus sp.]|nr:Cysteinyl-tRNA synthetase-like protein [Actinoallomurus sp.]